VIGFSPLKDPIQGPEARRAIELRTLVLTGPFDLRQGGVGVVGRNPVFIRTPDGSEQFWGLVQVLVRMPDLLVMTRLDALEQSGLRYELWRMRPGGGGRHVFASSSTQPLESPVDIAIKVPNGEWVLSAAPDKGWHSRTALIGAGLVVLIVALLGGAASYLLLSRGSRS
jgi:sensor domain CHASE-containing protein